MGLLLRLQYSHIDKPIGYLRILPFGGYSRHNDLRALKSAMDKIFSYPNPKKLIIDMRLSLGGSDELGFAIARRLTNRQYPAYIVQARSDPLEPGRWTPGDPIMVTQASTPVFVDRSLN